MATVRPFKAIRPAKEFAAKLASLPYDVMSRSEAYQMAKSNPYSFLRICRAEIELPENVEDYDKKVYEQARKKLDSFIADGILVQDKKPMLYVYRQVMNGHVQTGIVGCAAVSEYEDGTIKKHELTRVEKEQDRINHFDVCDANTESVFLTYRDDPRIRNIIEGYIHSRDPEYDFETADGVRHILWPMYDDNVVNGLVGLFEDVPYLYIADGHHRSASAAKIGAKRRDADPNSTGEEEYNFFMATIFPESDLKIFDYNRLIKDLAGNTKEEFFDKIRQAGFSLEEIGPEATYPDKAREFTMYLDGIWYRLNAKDEISPDQGAESLDVAILQDNLLGPVLGIKDPRTDARIDFVGGIRGLGELERRVKADMAVAFAVFPVTMEKIMELADAGEIMPPKSTWFEPKLASGLFIHSLTDDRKLKG